MNLPAKDETAYQRQYSKYAHNKKNHLSDLGSQLKIQKGVLCGWAPRHVSKYLLAEVHIPSPFAFDYFRASWVEITTYV